MVVMAITRGMVRRKDRLSELPDDLLSFQILAKLPPRYALRCSVLSRRWRLLCNELSQDSRQKIVNNITDTLQRRMPFAGPDGMNELRKIALRFEEKIYAAARDQQEYLRKISLKMISLRNHVSRDGNPLAGGSSSGNQKPLDPGLMMPPQLRNTLVYGNVISLPGQSQPTVAAAQGRL